VAERAGVSIGTLYQYFADKNAILIALARHEMAAAMGDVRRALEQGTDGTVEGHVRAMVRAIIHAFRGRARARKAVLQGVLAQGAGMEMMAPVAAFINQLGAQVGQGTPAMPRPLSREQLFVMSRAMLGAIRSAVLEEQPFLRSRPFEDEIVRLVLAYLSVIMKE